MPYYNKYIAKIGFTNQGPIVIFKIVLLVYFTSNCKKRILKPKAFKMLNFER